MKNLLTYILVVTSFLYGHAQGLETLYFISGHPYENTDQMFRSVLWKYYADSLEEVAELSNSRDLLESIKLYPEEHVVLIHKSNAIGKRKNGENNRIIIINFLEYPFLKEVVITYDDYSLMKMNLLKNDKSIAIGLDLFNSTNNTKDKKDVFLSIGALDSSIHQIDIDQFKYTVLTGYPGGAIDGEDYVIVYSDEQSGFLEIPKTGERSKRPKFPYELPEELRFYSYNRHIVPINNDYIFVVDGEKKTNETGIGLRELKILNKQTNQWHIKYINGSLLRARGFKEWIVGYVYNEKIKNKILPGSELWDYRASGLSPMDRFKSYAPGILYFYNAYTKAYFELETNQADSEVILVLNEQVIYRKYDELYLAPILKGEKLGKSELLLKDELVPDIHWAFISKDKNE